MAGSFFEYRKMSKAKTDNQEVKLTGKQELFVRHYLVSLNATDAARKAGYQGTSETLAVTGHETLRNPKVARRIKVALDERSMPPEEVLMRLTQQARGDHGNFWQFDHSGRRISLDLEALLEAGFGHLIKEYEVHELTGEITKLKFYDAQAALVHVGKYHKMFTDKTELSSPDGSMTPPQSFTFVPYVKPDSNNS